MVWYGEHRLSLVYGLLLYLRIEIRFLVSTSWLYCHYLAFWSACFSGSKLNSDTVYALIRHLILRYGFLLLLKCAYVEYSSYVVLIQVASTFSVQDVRSILHLSFSPLSTAYIPDHIRYIVLYLSLLLSSSIQS